MYDLIVIGGGVSGLMAASTASKAGLKVVVLEKMERVARKLRITGKGRCNITNSCDKAAFMAKVRSGRGFIDHALEALDNLSTVELFRSMGVEVIEERGGRIFPKSGRATDVADAMERWAIGAGAEIVCQSTVSDIICEQGKVRGVRLESGRQLEARAVLITTGGVSYPRTGSTGDGHRMAYDTGHEIVALRPALVPLATDEDLAPLAETELRNVKVSLIVDNEQVDSRFGDVTFYAESIAGATVLTLSRTAVDAITDGKSVDLCLDLKAALTHSKLLARIDRERASIPQAPIGVLLDRLTPRKMHQLILRRAEINRKTLVDRLSDSQCDALVKTLKNLTFHIVDYRPFSEAIVTAGGVSLDQVDPQTMQSRLVSGLYFAGEILDIDADTGGYNIQLALSTAFVAANSVGRTL